MSPLGPVIQKHRERLGLDAKAAAKQAKIGEATWRRTEQSQTQPREETVAAIASVLKTTPEKLRAEARRKKPVRKKKAA